MQLDISRNRDKSVDTLKFTLMCLVIFGHCMEKFNLHKVGYIEHIYQYIYLFHMPLFVFISGYFINREQDKHRFYKSLLYILETYIVFQLPSYILSCIHGLKNPINLLNPTWAMWFLPSLIVWRFIIYNTSEKILKHWILVLSFLCLISVIGGFINYSDFAFQRIITYFPMFMMGYYCKVHNCLSKIKSIPLWTSVIICISIMFSLFATNIHTSPLFYQNGSYFTQPIPIISGCLFRIGWYIATFLLSISILPLLLRIKNQKMAVYGCHTLLFYVVHVFILNYVSIVFSKIGILKYHILFMVVFVALIILLCLLARTKYCNFITNPISAKRRKKG